MKDSLYNKYFKKRNESLETLDQKFNSKRVYETFNSALKFFNFNTFNQNQQLIDLGVVIDLSLNLPIKKVL